MPASRRAARGWMLPDWLLADGEWEREQSGGTGAPATTGVVLSVAEERHLGEGQGIGMGDGQERRSPPIASDGGRAPAQPSCGGTATAHNLDVAPQNTLRVPGSEGFHRRFWPRSAGEVVDGARGGGQ